MEVVRRRQMAKEDHHFSEAMTKKVVSFFEEKNVTPISCRPR